MRGLQLLRNNAVALVSSKMACTVSQWEFKHLEVVGARFSSPDEFDAISSRIPRLKVETKTRILKRKDEQPVEVKAPRFPTKRQSLLGEKPQKEKIVTIKVVIPKKKSEVLERNYLCTCEERDSMSELSSKDGKETNKDLEFRELMDLLRGFDEGSMKDSLSGLRSTAKRFHRNKLLSWSETIEVLKLLDTDNNKLKEGILFIISQFCTSTVNVKRFLDNGLMNKLIDVVLLSEEDNIKREAVLCLSQVVDKTEHASLWLDLMTISGVDALFNLMDTSGPLQEAVVLVIKNLAAHPKAAQVILKYGLDSFKQLIVCKSTYGNYIGNPEVQGLITHLLTNLISHDSHMVEEFLSKHDDAIKTIVDLLQYSPCLQQQQSARFIATLAYHKPGLAALVSHNAIEHVLWAVTCSQCRKLREHASTALRRITANPDRTTALSAFCQAVNLKSELQEQTFSPSNNSRTFSSTEDYAHEPSKSHLFGSSSSETLLDRNISSNLQRTLSEVTSLLAITFQSDALCTSGSERQFSQPHHSAEPSLRLTRLKQPNNFFAKEKYLGSLQVLTNTLIVISNLILMNEKMEDKSGDIPDKLRRLDNAALVIQHGGLKFLPELEFLSNKLLKANPPSFHNIDPTILPPKETTTTTKNARTHLIFRNRIKKSKESGTKYTDFGFEPNEVEFVKAALELLCIFAETTAPEFDPCLEDIRVLLNSRPSGKKRHISFHKSATTMNNSSKENKRTNSSKNLRKRPLSRSVSLASMDTSTSSKPSQSSSLNGASTQFAQSTSFQDSRDTIHYVKQSLLDSKVIYCLAPWIMCGIYDIQANALKIIRYLQHSKYAPSVPPSLAHPSARVAWASKASSHSPTKLGSRSSTLSQRSLNSPTPGCDGMNKSKYLGVTCVRHVIQHCGGYLLDSLGPPVSRALGKTTLMVIREAVINGALDTRLKIIKLGCFAHVIEYIRGNEDDEDLQALGMVVIRILIGHDKSLKQLFLAHGGMNLLMALYQYKQGIAKEEAALTMISFRQVFKGGITRRHRKSRTADPKVKKRPKSNGHGDIWEKVGEKWKGQDEVMKVLTKFNVRY